MLPAPIALPPGIADLDAPLSSSVETNDRECLLPIDPGARNALTESIPFPGHSSELGAPAPDAPNPSLPQAVLAAADFYYAQGQLAVARDFLILLEPAQAHTASTRQTLGSLHFQLGEFALAKRAFDQALLLQPANAALLTQSALTCLRLDDTATFETLLEQALSLEPDNPVALKILADYSREHKRYAEAARLYHRLLHLQPTQVELYLCLANSLYHLGDVETTRIVLERALKLDPSNTIARENLALLPHPLAETGIPAKPDPTARPAERGSDRSSPLPQEAQEALARADAYYAKGALAEAATELRRALAILPARSELLSALGCILNQLGNHSEALATLQQACAAKPDDTESLVCLATAALHAEAVPLFEESLTRALRLEPDNRNALRLVGNANLQLGRFQDAANAFFRLTKLAPADAPAWLALAKCRFELGQRAASIAACERVLELDPHNVLARQNLEIASSRDRAGRPDNGRSA